MKKLIPIILFLTSTLFFSCKNITMKNSLSSQNIFGKVKTVTTNCYTVRFNSSEWGKYEKDTLIDKTVISFDTYGNQTSRISYDSKGIIKTEFQYTYDEKHHIIKTKTRKSNEKLHTIYNYEYSGNEQIESQYNQEGELISTNTTKYNELGQRTETEICNLKDESKKEKYIYLYDSKGNWIESDKYNDTKIESKTIYQYDELGNWKRIFFSEGDLKEFNNEQEEIEKYNKNLASDPSAPPPPPPPPPPAYEIPFFEYFLFDKNNNWQKSTQKNGGVLITEREIVYY